MSGVRAVPLLLDQNFPKPPSGMRIDTLDRKVDYKHLSAVAPAHSRVSTPDWMVYLIARDHGFGTLVTSDHSQLDQDEELVALSLTGLCLITWKGRQLDPIVMWGQLLAYMPQILPHLSTPRTVVQLPNPRLNPKEHISRTHQFIGARQAVDGVSFAERRAAALKVMRQELARRGVPELETHLPVKRRVKRVLAPPTQTASRPSVAPSDG